MFAPVVDRRRDGSTGPRPGRTTGRGQRTNDPGISGSISTTSRTAPRPPAATRDEVRGRPGPRQRRRPGRRPGRRRRAPAGRAGRRRRSRPAAASGRAGRPGRGTVRPSRPFPWRTWAILSSAARRSTASRVRPERIAERFPRVHRRTPPVADVKMLRLHAVVVERDDAVGQDAVDVDDQQLDRPATLGQFGPGRDWNPWAVTPRSRRARGRSGRSRRSGRPAVSAAVDHRQLADLAGLHHLDRLGQRRADADLDRVGRHHLADRPVEVGLAPPLEQPGEVAVGEDPQEDRLSSSSIRTAPERPRGPARRTKTARTVSPALRPADLAAGPHHVLDPQQLPPQAPRRDDTARSPRR